MKKVHFLVCIVGKNRVEVKADEEREQKKVQSLWVS